MEDHLNRRQPQWKTTSMKDDLNGRQTQWNTTSIEDNLNGRQFQWKMTSRKPYRKQITSACLASKSYTELGPAQPQLVLAFSQRILKLGLEIRSFSKSTFPGLLKNVLTFNPRWLEDRVPVTQTTLE